MILETFVAVNSAVLATRAINTKIETKMKDKILTAGLYHVTTAENAQKIMESGYIKPSNSILSLGRKKCFFFAGLPSYRDLSSNCASEASKYEFKAIKLEPNSEEISKFRQRSFNDDSITFQGRCELPEERTRIVDLVLDIDEKGNIYTREKTEEEMEKYVPNPELVKKMTTLNSNVLSILGKSYVKEYQTVGSKLISKLKAFADRIKSSKIPKLTGTDNEKQYTNIDEEDSREYNNVLMEQVYEDQRICANYMEEKAKSTDENIIDKEIV